MVELPLFLTTLVTPVLIRALLLLPHTLLSPVSLSPFPLIICFRIATAIRALIAQLNHINAIAPHYLILGHRIFEFITMVIIVIFILFWGDRGLLEPQINLGGAGAAQILRRECDLRIELD